MPWCNADRLSAEANTATLQFCLGNTSGNAATSYTVDAQGLVGSFGTWGDMNTQAQTAWGTKTSASAASNAATIIPWLTAQIQMASNSGGTLTLQTAADGTHGITVQANAVCTLTQEN